GLFGSSAIKFRGGAIDLGAVDLRRGHYSLPPRWLGLGRLLLSPLTTWASPPQIGPIGFLFLFRKASLFLFLLVALKEPSRMPRTRLSLFYLIGYLVPSGLAFLLAPQLTLKLLFSNGSYGDVMPRLVGVFILTL